MTRVLIVDDHALVRHALSHIINQSPDLELCGLAENADSARECVKEHRPDLVILDLCLGQSRCEGIGLIEEIRRDSPNTMVLVSSMQDESQFARRAIAAGASGFISKTESVEAMSMAIRRVLAGHVYVSERATMTPDEPGPENRLANLSRREMEIFELVGQGNSPHDIADRLNIGIKTVDAHRQNIRRKLGLASMGDLIRQAAIWSAAAN